MHDVYQEPTHEVDWNNSPDHLNNQAHAEWHAARDNYVAMDNMRCEMCGYTGMSRVDLKPTGYAELDKLNKEEADLHKKLNDAHVKSMKARRDHIKAHNDKVAHDAKEAHELIMIK